MLRINWREWVFSLYVPVSFRDAWQGKHKRDYAEWYQSLPIGAVDALREIEAENPYSDYREPITESSDRREPWAHSHNSHLEQLASEQSAQWRTDRLDRIRHIQQCRKLELAIAKYHRRNATPHVSPVETECKYPMPAINLAGEDTTEKELQTLLATIRNDERRADVAAQCWVVRAEYPSAPALHVFNRASKICQMVNRGIYSDGERMRAKRHGIDSHQYLRPMTARSIAYWQDSLESLNKAEREELAIVFAKSRLNDDTLLSHLLDGRTPQEICRDMGISTATYYRRLQAVQVR